jgi:hypothetical protein
MKKGEWIEAAVKVLTEGKMNEVNLLVEITVERDADGRNLITSRCCRAFKLPVQKSAFAKAWGTRRFNVALNAARADEVVKVEISGSSEDASHHLAAGRMFGWSGKVQARHGVFEK